MTTFPGENNISNRAMSGDELRANESFQGTYTQLVEARAREIIGPPADFIHSDVGDKILTRKNGPVDVILSNAIIDDETGQEGLVINATLNGIPVASMVRIITQSEGVVQQIVYTTLIGEDHKFDISPDSNGTQTLHLSQKMLGQWTTTRALNPDTKKDFDTVLMQMGFASKEIPK